MQSNDDQESHHGMDPSRWEGGAEPGIQVARIDTLLVPLVVWVASLRPAKNEARATIGLCEIKVAIAIKEGRRGFSVLGTA